MPQERRQDSTFSSETTGTWSSAGGSYSYYSEGYGSYYSHGQSRRSTVAGTTSTPTSSYSDAASSKTSYSSSAGGFSNADASSSSAKSQHTSSLSTPRCDTRSLASSSDVIEGNGKSVKASGGVGTSARDPKASAAGASSVHSPNSKPSASIASSSTNGVTADDTDALVAASSTEGNPLSLTAPAHSTHGLPMGVPASPYHFSEEELAGQPWTVEAGEAATPTSEGGSSAAKLCARNVLETIRTTAVEAPPSPEEAQQRRREGGLPYPSHLTFRIVPGVAKGAKADGSGDGRKEGGKGETSAGGEGYGKAGAAGRESTTRLGRAKKVLCTTCCGAAAGESYEATQRKVDERENARQKSHHNALHSHHVPLVKFRTGRDRVHLLDGETTLPTVEEAAGYRHEEEDRMGTEAKPRKLEKAMRQCRRPGSGLHFKTSYAFGRRAGGGRHGGGQSVFLRDGNPQRFWIAQLHERAEVHLEPIETE